MLCGRLQPLAADVFMETKRWTKFLSPAAQSPCDDLASQPSPQNEGKPLFLSLARAGDRQTDRRHLIPTPYPPQQDPTSQCLNPHPSEVQGPPRGQPVLVFAHLRGRGTQSHTTGSSFSKRFKIYYKIFKTSQIFKESLINISLIIKYLL